MLCFKRPLFKYGSECQKSRVHFVLELIKFIGVIQDGHDENCEVSPLKPGFKSD
jgi:hypothetical protein